MAQSRWTVQLADGTHTVELEHGYWSGKRRILVDGQLVHESQNLLDGGTLHEVPIGAQTGVVRITSNGLTFRYDLVVDGRSATTGEPADATAPTSPAWITKMTAMGATTRDGRPVFTRENLAKELRGVGVSMLLLGVMLLLEAHILLKLWGIVVAGVGFACFKVHRPAMILAMGGAIVGTGALTVITAEPDRLLPLGLGIFLMMIGLASSVRYFRFADGLARQQQEEK